MFAKRNCLSSQGPRGEEGEEGSEGDPVSDHTSCRTKPQMARKKNKKKKNSSISSISLWKSCSVIILFFFEVYNSFNTF